MNGLKEWHVTKTDLWRTCEVDLVNPDFVHLTESYGAAAYRVSPGETARLRRAMREALSYLSCRFLFDVQTG